MTEKLKKLPIKIEYDPWIELFPIVLSIIGNEYFVRCESAESDRLSMPYWAGGFYQMALFIADRHSQDRLSGIPFSVLEKAELAVDESQLNKLKYWASRLEHHWVAINVAVEVLQIRNSNAFIEAAEALMRGEQ